VLLFGVASLMAGSTTGVPMLICFLHQPLHQLDFSSFNQFAVMGNIMLNVYQSIFVLFVNMPVIDININIFNCFVNYNVVLLSDVVSLMAGSITSVPISFGYGYQTAMPTSYYTITAYASAGYYTIKAPGNYTTTYDVQSYYTDPLNCV
jgi:hypothetical protein